MNPTNAEIVERFCHEFDVPAPDPERIGAYFTEDAIYHNIPMEAVAGRAAITAAIRRMGAVMQSAGWEVIHQVVDGDMVMNERIDRFSANGRAVEIPVVGVFELRDGKIRAWRDYFDLATWQKQLL